jgi:hypothetical protein
MNTLIILGIVLLVSIPVVFIFWYFFGSKPQYPPFSDDDQDSTGWRESRNYPGQFFKYNHRTDQFFYCEHRNISYSFTTDFDREAWVCPDCGHTEYRRF